MIHVRRKRKTAALHLMLLPAVLILAIYSYGPTLGSFIAFQDFTAAQGFLKSPWIGFDNFAFVMRMPGFFSVIWNTVYISVLKMVGLIVVPVVVSLLLNEIAHEGFKRTIQSMIYMPNFLSWVILSGTLIEILSPSSGIVNGLLGVVGIKPIFFLGNTFWFPLTLVASEIWKSFGYSTVIYLAALTSIDPSLYEAATVDGANRWQQMKSVTLPGILPIIVLMSVLSLGNILNAGFDQVFNLYSPQVYDTGDILDTFIYRLGLVEAQFGPATAVGLFKTAVSLLFIVASYWMADRFAKYRIL